MNTYLIVLSILAVFISVPATAQAQISSAAYEDPKILMGMATILSKHGFVEAQHELIHLAENAKRKAELNTFQSLLLGDIDRAIDAAKLSGRPFADRPVKVKPRDPNDNTWKIQYEGSPETIVNVKTLFDLHAQIVQAIAPSPYAGSFARLSKSAEAEPPEESKERDLRMQLMQEQRRALRAQEQHMINQNTRNSLQIMQMLGPQPGQVPSYGY